MKMLYVIGDIHGCKDELVELLEKVDQKIRSEDEIVFLGDYIDRGPDSKGVVDVLIDRSLNHPNKHVFIKGNHEDMMMDDQYLWRMNGGLEAQKSYGYVNDEWKSPINPMSVHEDFYNNLVLYYQVGRTVCVHAGLDPSLSLAEQNERTLIWSRAFNTYKGMYMNNYFVVHGHTPDYSIKELPNKLNIDTACVFGGKLTCAIIEPDSGFLFDTLTVKSKSAEKF